MKLNPLGQWGRWKSVGLLLIRIVVGIIFIRHGWMKVDNMEGTIGFFGSLGLAPFFAYFVAWVEVLGGISIILGIFTFVAGIALAVDMLFAIILVVGKNGFGGMELELLLLVSSLAIALGAIGKWSLARSHYGCNCGNCNWCKSNEAGEVTTK